MCIRDRFCSDPGSCQSFPCQVHISPHHAKKFPRHHPGSPFQANGQVRIGLGPNWAVSKLGQVQIGPGRIGPGPNRGSKNSFPRATSEGFLLCRSPGGAELSFPGGAGGLPRGCQRVAAGLPPGCHRVAAGLPPDCRRIGTSLFLRKIKVLVPGPIS